MFNNSKLVQKEKVSNKNIDKENITFLFDNYYLFLHLSKWNKISFYGNTGYKTRIIALRSSATLQLTAQELDAPLLSARR